MKSPLSMLTAIIEMQKANYGNCSKTHVSLIDLVSEAESIVDANTESVDGPETTFFGTAVDISDGSTSVRTDCLALTSDSEPACHYKLEAGKRYKITLNKV